MLLGFGIGNLTRADSAKTAQTLLRERTFDLVISATNMAEGSTATSWSSGCAAALLEANRYLAVILVSGHTPPLAGVQGPRRRRQLHDR